MSGESFYEGLLDVQTQLCQRATAEVTRLRKEVARLQGVIDSYPATASELQDRLTMAEQQLATLRTAHALSAQAAGSTQTGGPANAASKPPEGSA